MWLSFSNAVESILIFLKFYSKIFWCHKKCSASYFQKKVGQTDHRNWSTYSILIALQKMWNPLFALQHPHGKTLVIVTSVSPEGLLQCHKCLLCMCACVGVGVCVCVFSHTGLGFLIWFLISHMLPIMLVFIVGLTPDSYDSQSSFTQS